ncbi:Protein CBG20814 [Caenorhabditis briggsae]|uniref:Protein CBG20814 n=1 Tax=Caenorhabditis briggsae TaxID=6238 RepID=A8XYP2_CAEBR|nr:Protein CBG20814 [Caenorhabditis briggsae]CAP37758.1 Protein CBG20814 [Caenorhabditis briggsae]
MRLHPGANETALTYDFDFKMGIQFNVGCTNRWTVTWLDVLCHPHIDFMEENYLSMRGLFMKELISTYEEEDQLYPALTALTPFV